MVNYIIANKVEQVIKEQVEVNKACCFHKMFLPVGHLIWFPIRTQTFLLS